MDLMTSSGVETVDVLHVDRVVHLVLDGLGHVGCVHEPLQEGSVRDTVDPRRHVELVMKVTTARDHPEVLRRIVQLKMPHARERLLVADAEDRLHTLALNQLLLDALQNLVDVLICGSADVHDGLLVHELALPFVWPVVRVREEHVVAVPLHEDGPEAIELRFARLRRVRLEDVTNGAKGRFVRVLPTACDEAEHMSATMT